jgi:hypothetical protein
MPESIVALMEKLQPDPWRAHCGFSAEIQGALDKVLGFSPGSEQEATAILNDWIRHHQPCLFGRIAAKQAAITYCFITEDALYGGERELAKQIQNERLRWTRAGFEGTSSSFIIAVLSKRLSEAVPDETVKAIALRICSLYLQEEIEPDQVYLDRLWLEQPVSGRPVWEWLAGVNYFSAQGDGRWWQDHRFPAGIAFSVNSVGHMVKAGKLARAMRDLEETMDTASLDFKAPDVHSLEQALGLAMSTISRASQSNSGKVTYLLPVEGYAANQKCPVEISKYLDRFDCSHYEGFYHTDYTIPSEYFRPEVLKPDNICPYDLDFTYLFREDLDNPDFDRMGEGRRIRHSELSADEKGIEADWIKKRLRGLETEVYLADLPRLREALSRER